MYKINFQIKPPPRGVWPESHAERELCAGRVQVRVCTHHAKVVVCVDALKARACASGALHAPPLAGSH